jgi:membrane protease YdiL (CAAX protease family)
MEKTKIWIMNHQVAAFFLLAYLITWPGFLLVFFIFPGNQAVEGLSMPCVFGPALAAMIVAGIADSEPKQAPSKWRWITFLFVWALGSAVQILYFMFVHKVELIVPIIIISCVFALLPAWMTSNAFARRPGIRNTFLTLIKSRGSWFWYLVIFLIFPGFPLVSVLITRLLGNQVPLFQANLGLGGMAAYFILEFSRGFLMTGGINEESGWRGFALPRLQSRYSILVSALIIWFFWAGWHLPYDFGRGIELRGILENRLIWNLVISIIISWLYNKTNGSLLAAALFHPAMNTFGNMITVTPVSQILLVILAAFTILESRMWKKLPKDHPAVWKPLSEGRIP